MNRALKEAAITTAPITSKVNNHPFHIRAALFHSTPLLLRKRRTNWDFARSGYRSAGAKKRDYWSRRASSMIIMNINLLQVVAACHGLDVITGVRHATEGVRPAKKATVEEKFKTCSAAYQSLCDKLTIS